MTTDNTPHIILDKELRRDIDAIIQRLKNSSDKAEWQRAFHLATVEGMPFNAPEPRASRERNIVVTKLQEAVMWLGMDLKAINDEGGGAENPYPHSKDPSTTIIDKTADGLKL